MTAPSLEAARTARELGADAIYLTADTLAASDIQPHEILELGIVPVLDEVCREADHARLDPASSRTRPLPSALYPSSALASTREPRAQLRSCIPVHNLACATMLAESGAQLAWLLPELTLAEIERFAPSAPSPSVSRYMAGRA